MSATPQIQRTRIWLGILVLLLVPVPGLAASNIWQSSFGQRTFYDTASAAGELMAGTDWESALTPGNVYTISFTIRQLQGRIGLLVGDLPVIPLDRPGAYTFAFTISDDGGRRMLFQALIDQATARVSAIAVVQKPVRDRFQLPTGHYWSFDHERNLVTEMVAPLANPGSTTAYRLGIAQDLHDALTTPGVRGFWMAVDWRTVEVGDGRYDWRLIDDNMKVARSNGLRFVIEVSDRSFDSSNVMPAYFPPAYVVAYSGNSGGIVAKRWDPYVYNRLIRLYTAIAQRYAADPAFGGIATSETALGDVSGSDYTLDAYATALIQIVTQTQLAMKRGNLLFYLNFLLDGDRSDMNRDARIGLLRNVPDESLMIGAPDITPDFKGMVRSVSPYRIHARKTLPEVKQFCHLQHVDQGHRGTNVKSNQYRQEYLDEVARVRDREAQSWFSGQPAVFEFDDVGLHPAAALGNLWQPQELLDFGRRNFGCSRVLWHYRNIADWQGASWQDIRDVILQNQNP